MNLTVCDALDAPRYVQHRGYDHVLTVIDAGYDIDLSGEHRWTMLNFSDLEDPNHPASPTIRDVFSIIDFGMMIRRGEKVLVHCFAGISRSTSTALIIKHGVDPELGPEELADWIIGVRPVAYPNGLMGRLSTTAFGDDTVERAVEIVRGRQDEKYNVLKLY